MKDLKYYDNTINELASRQRFSEMLGERWIFIYGDSTSRVFFNTLLDAVGMIEFCFCFDENKHRFAFNVFTNRGATLGSIDVWRRL